MTGSPFHERELAGIVQRDRARRHRQPAPVDRTNPAWRRLRAACCEFTGGIDLDKHADNIFLAVRNATARTGTPLDGTGAGAGKEVPV